MTAIKKRGFREARGKRQEARGKRQEARGKRQEAKEETHGFKFGSELGSEGSDRVGLLLELSSLLGLCLVQLVHCRGSKG